MRFSSPASTSQSATIACITAAVVVAATGYSFYLLNDGKKNTKESESNKNKNDDDKDLVVIPSSIPGQIDITSQEGQDDLSKLQRIQTSNTITIAYASTTGTCESFAKSLQESLLKLMQSRGGNDSIKIQVCTVNELDWWDELLNNENDDNTTPSNNTPAHPNSNGLTLPPMVIFVLPTWTNGTLPEQYSTLLTSLDEICHDWRVAPRPLRNEEESTSSKGRQKRNKLDSKTVQIASFGMGSTAYDKSTFCKPAKDVFKFFMKLGARSLLVSHGRGVVGTGDDDAGDCKKSFQEWKTRVVSRIEEIILIQQSQNKHIVKESKAKSSTGCCQQEDEKEGEMSSACACQEEKTSSEGGGCCNNEAKISEEDEYNDDEEEYSDDDYSDDEYDEEKEPDVMDLEDIGNAMNNSTKGSKKDVVKEMVTPKQAKALKKEGYRIIGTHSAVKLCRWTKHQLRGRGGCYKHTFYGITSYQCMEATPSLACANKCKYFFPLFKFKSILKLFLNFVITTSFFCLPFLNNSQVFSVGGIIRTLWEGNGDGR